MNDISDRGHRVAILVVGMHRSGTSALTGLINLLGVPLGHELAGAAFDNESGFWENQAVVRLHERILQFLGSAWDDAREFPVDWLEQVESAGFGEALAEVIGQEFGGKALWAVKDPRLCRFLPLWLRVLAQLRIEPRLLFALRHPAEVVGSLVRRNGLSPAVASMLWTRHLIEPLRASRENRRWMVDYAGLLSDWSGCAKTIADGLGVIWPAGVEGIAGEVRGFLRPELRHQHSAQDEELLPEPWRAAMLRLHAESLHVMRGELEWEALDASLEDFLARMAFASPLFPQLQVKSRIEQLDADLTHALEARDVYRGEAARLFAESAAAKEEASQAKGEASRAKGEASLAKGEASAARDEAARSNAQLIAARGELVKRQARIATLELARLELEQIKASRSWKLTRPLRVVMRLLRNRGRLGEADREQLRRRLGRMTRPVDPPAGAMQEASPASAPVAVVLPQLATQEAGRPDVFVWSVIDWHFRIQRPQHLARELAMEGHRVFYVSCQFIDSQEPGFRVEPLDADGRLFQVQFNLAGAAAIYSQMPTPDAREQLRAGLGQLLAWTGSRSCLSLVQHAYWLEISRELPNARLVYDCMDHHGGFENNGPEVLARESELMRTADLLVVTSQWLYDEAAKFNPRVLMVRNACEYGHFAQPASPCFHDARGRKVIGYYGAIAEWFDLDLLEAVASRFSDCLVLMVGADTTGASKRLGHLDNVQFTGEVPYAELPFYLTGFDVCLLPFQVIPLTLATNPVKVYEYLSAGKEVVAIDLPEMSQFRGLVRTAADHEDFLQQVAMALTASADSSQVERRRAFASEQTWAHRVRDLAHGVASLPQPPVSVVVVTYNNLELTRACLDSLERYSDYGNLEVIVVDNASSDDTPSFLRDWASRGDRRRVILNEDNRGFAAANNQGLAAATGDYLVMLNNDTYVTPGWVGTLVGHLRRDHTLGMLGPVTNNIGNEARIDIRYEDMAGMLGAAGEYTARHVGQLTPLRTAAFFCVMLRREVFEKVGPLDEAFGIGFFEDDDYCRRVEQAGWSIACAEDVFIHHHLSASFNKLNQERRARLFEENKALYEKKWGPWVPHRYRPGVT